MPNEPENNSSASSSSSSSEPENKPRNPRGPFDQAKVDKIDEARDIIAAYRKPEFKQILIDKRDVFEADVNDLEALCDRAERSITGGHAATVLKEQLTAEEAAARAVMNAVIDLVQRGALRTFRGEQRARLGVTSSAKMSIATSAASKSSPKASSTASPPAKTTPRRSTFSEA